MDLERYGVIVSPDMEKYFAQLEKEYDIKLTDGQKAWYIKKADTQLDYMTREFPATWEEAFSSANEGFYWAALVAKARTEHRICNIPPDDHALKFAAWDIGMSDSTAIWTFQVVGREVHYLDYYENSGEALAHYADWIKKRPYTIEKHFMPHDAGQRELGTGRAYTDYAKDMGLKVELIPRAANELIDIEMVRVFFPRLWFDQMRCERGIKCVESFRKEWNEKMACYRERSYHNFASHAAKALIYSLNGVDKMTGSKCLSAEEWRTIRGKYT